MQHFKVKAVRCLLETKQRLKIEEEPALRVEVNMPSWLSCGCSKALSQSNILF